jgi:hypothetical protein
VSCESTAVENCRCRWVHTSRRTCAALRPRPDANMAKGDGSEFKKRVDDDELNSYVIVAGVRHGWFEFPIHTSTTSSPRNCHLHSAFLALCGDPIMSMSMPAARRGKPKIVSGVRVCRSPNHPQTLTAAASAPEGTPLLVSSSADFSSVPRPRSKTPGPSWRTPYARYRTTMRASSRSRSTTATRTIWSSSSVSLRCSTGSEAK